MSKSKKILLVEDEEFLCIAYSDYLKQAGFKVEIAMDGEEAIAKLEKEIPNLVLLDLIMPLKDGFEVLLEMKISEKWKNIPVIIFTNMTRDEDVVKSNKLGAADFLIKSNYSLNEFLAKVKVHC